MIRSKFFTAEKITGQVTRIAGMGGELCYLIEGERYALLIDGLAGIGSLKAFVRELTELPVTLAVTHGHIDHVGAAWEYGEVCIHPGDIPLMYEPVHAAVEERLGYINARKGQGPAWGTEPAEADVPEAKAVKTYPIYEGDRFDLGGVELEVIEVPGHTDGTVVFLDRASRILFSGDACNSNTLVNLLGSASIARYRESLLHFKTFQNAFDVMYGGHGPAAVPNTIIDDGIMLCERILSHEDDAIETPSFRGQIGYLAAERGEQFRPLYGGDCNIVYDKNGIDQRPFPAVTGVPFLKR